MNLLLPNEVSKHSLGSRPGLPHNHNLLDIACRGAPQRRRLSAQCSACSLIEFSRRQQSAAMVEKEPAAIKAAGGVPESVLKKRKRDEDWATKKAAAVTEAKKKSKDKRKDIFKRAEKYVKEYRDQVRSSPHRRAAEQMGRAEVLSCL